jgi:hypothetical protein
MKLMIGVPTGENGRRADFHDHFNGLQKPDDTLIMFTHGQSPAKNRNVIAEAALEHGCSHILYIDDDMVFAQDTLTRLLVHADKDVVSGLYLLRNYPHYPVIFDEHYRNGECRFMFLTPEKSGLVEIVNCGFGFVLIQTKVFQTLSKPWVRLGEIKQDEWCDDIGFFNRVRQAGFRLYCDLDIQVGHALTLTMWPRKKDGNWNTEYVTHTGESFQFPQVQKQISGA